MGNFNKGYFKNGNKSSESGLPVLIAVFCWSEILKILVFDQQEPVIRARAILILHDLLRPVYLRFCTEEHGETSCQLLYVVIK